MILGQGDLGTIFKKSDSWSSVLFSNFSKISSVLGDKVLKRLLKNYEKWSKPLGSWKIMFKMFICLKWSIILGQWSIIFLNIHEVLTNDHVLGKNEKGILKTFSNFGNIFINQKAFEEKTRGFWKKKKKNPLKTPSLVKRFLKKISKLFTISLKKLEQ